MGWKYTKLLERAERQRLAMEKSLVPINTALSSLLDDYNASVLFQHSDGWVVLFGADHNAKIDHGDLDLLLTLSKEDALEFLHDRTL